MIERSRPGIKIYCDGADFDSMIELAALDDVHGLTTNPSLMRKSGITDYRGFCRKVLERIRVKPISFEVFADDFEEMGRQAREIASWGKNVYAKIPIMNSEGRSAIALIRELSDEGIHLNVTAVLTLRQVIEATEAMKNGPESILSVFAGRIADTGRDPMPLMRAALELCRAASPKIELLWASTREVFNIVQAEESGCAIITVPFDILKKRSMFGKSLEEVSLDTVKTFKNDAEKAGFSL